MKIIAITLARNEEWILEAGLRNTLRWCDEAIVVDHCSTDATPDILLRLGEETGRVIRIPWSDPAFQEMTMRTEALKMALARGATHIAWQDADELPTANVVPQLRGWFEQLPAGHVLELPMVGVWRSLDNYRKDDSVWSRATMSIGAADAARLSWPLGTYQLHNRTPQGVTGSRCPVERHTGGVFHVQFADRVRMVAKHAWYKMDELVRWPGRRSVNSVDQMYNQAVRDEGAVLAPIPADWWYEDIKRLIKIGLTPWFVDECRAMLAKHGREYFAGLDLFGVV